MKWQDVPEKVATICRSERAGVMACAPERDPLPNEGLFYKAGTGETLNIRMELCEPYFAPDTTWLLIKTAGPHWNFRHHIKRAWETPEGLSYLLAGAAFCAGLHHSRQLLPPTWMKRSFIDEDDETMSSRGSFGAAAVQSIPVDAFGRAVGVGMMANPYGTRNPFGNNEQPLVTPFYAGTVASGLVSGAGALSGQSRVSPLQVGLMAAQAGGVGLLAGLGVGKVLGALANISPAAQGRLQQIGMWSGLLTGAIRGLTR